MRIPNNPRAKEELFSNKNWQVPNFSVEFDQGKYNQYCLIIPIINEGKRIIEFIRKLYALKIHKILDILIIDGGSTDGVLKRKFLLDHKVNKLLVKKDVGKLSSQLRIAYAYAIENKYQGLITIDGNNKDDPTSLPTFIEGLKNGYDFLQSSRFVKGGKHINTPFFRYLAIRLIHAPILSLASGFRWTDTTQGYRAYSSKALIDPRVDIFRDIFSKYELLAYLNYRLPRIGLKCCELPTTRIYPKGKVPTKISSVKGNIDLIKVLFKASLGFYNP